MAANGDGVFPVEVIGFDGVKLHSWSVGGGEDALVFVHGFCQGAHVWGHQKQLGETMKVVAYDLRGHGHSDKPVGCDYQDPVMWAEDLEAVLDAHGVRRATLVGWSYGGRVVLDFLQHAVTGSLGRVAGVVMVGAMIRANETVFGSGMRHKPGMLSVLPPVSMAATRAFTNDMFFEGCPVAQRWSLLSAATPVNVRRAMDGRPLDATTWASGFQGPVLVVHGRHDKMILPVAAEYTHDVFPNSELVWFNSSAHCPFWEQPVTFNALLKSFTQRVFV